MIPENNIRPLSLVYMPVIYGRILEEGKVLESKNTKPKKSKSIKVTKNSSDRAEEMIKKSNLFECIRIRLDVTLNVPPEKRNQFNVEISLMIIKEKLNYLTTP